MFSIPLCLIITDFCIEMHASISLYVFWSGPFLTANILRSNFFPYHNISCLTMAATSIQQRTTMNAIILSNKKKADSSTTLDARSLQLQFGSTHLITHNDLLDLVVRNSKFPTRATSVSFLCSAFLFLKY